MTTSVLVLDPDLDALGRVGEALSRRGLEPILAQTIAQAKERARSRGPKVLLVSESIMDEPSLSDALARSMDISRLPRLILSRRKGSLPPGVVDREDTDKLAARVLELARESLLPSEPSGELRGDIAQAPLFDVVQLLAMNHRTGTLVLRSKAGTGELRLSDGEISDAVFRHLEGEKALIRILLATDGAFSFAPSNTPGTRRIQKPTNELLMDAMRQKDEMASLSLEFGDSWFVRQDAAPETTDGQGATLANGEEEESVLSGLSVKRSLPEILDDTSSPDVEVMQTLKRLLDRGVIVRAEGLNSRASIAPLEELPVLRALAGRLRRRGFAGTRIGITGTALRLATLGRTLVRGLSAQPPEDPWPTLPVPHELCSLPLGDQVFLTIVALPDDPLARPMAELVMPALGACIRLLDPGSPLDALAKGLGVRMTPALELCPNFDESDAEKVAELVRRCIEQVGTA